MTRAPLLTAKNPKTAKKVRNYIKKYWNTILKEVAESTTRYGKLTSLETKVVGVDIYMRMGMFCGDAAGHNMTTKAAQEICHHLEEKFLDKVKLISISSNYCTDKKPVKINIEKGRGKTVRATATIPEYLIKEHLRTTGKELEKLNYKKNIVGSKLAGSLGKNAHHANIVAAFLLPTGQDIANVVEGSLGETIVDFSDNELYFSVVLPSIIVGTVGGGIDHLPYAIENLKLLGCYGGGNPIGSNSKKLTEILAGCVGAGELSLLAALLNKRELIDAHIRFERCKGEII